MSKRGEEVTEIKQVGTWEEGGPNFGHGDNVIINIPMKSYWPSGKSKIHKKRPNSFG